MIVIFFGIVGVIIGYWLNGLMISLFLLNGILVFSGVVVNDSLLLVLWFNVLWEEGVLVEMVVIEVCISCLWVVLLILIIIFVGLYFILGEMLV